MLLNLGENCLLLQIMPDAVSSTAEIQILLRTYIHPIDLKLLPVFYNFQPIDGPVIASLNLTSEILFNPPICCLVRVSELLRQED
jgi:hypothetical protein